MVSPGTVGIKPAGVNHRFASQDDSEFIIIKLKPEFLTHIGQDWRDSESLELVPAIHSQSDPLLLQLGLALKGEIESGYPGGRMYGDSIATAIAAHLLRQYSSSNLAIADDATGLTANQLQNVVNYIQTYLDLSLSLGELANLVNLSPYYFSRLFKQSTGTTPYQYISQQRVERAKQLLRQTDLMIAEVALRCGFSSQSSFSTAFRKVVSMTPGAYRKSL
ncbi:MAG: helix-turn-helix domain-containing protein [Microcoleaceae cyanobacterium]